MRSMRGSLRRLIRRAPPSRSSRWRWALPWKWTWSRASNALALGAVMQQSGIDRQGIDRQGIAATYRVIAPFIRRTPVMEVDGADFGLGAFCALFKLELLQHAGSFKARGAF